MTPASCGKYHKWLLVLSTNPYVYCPNCTKQFKPAPQQLPYKGAVPEKYQQ